MGISICKSSKIWILGIKRKRLLLQGNFYIKQNYGESLPSVDELHEMLHTNSYSSLMKKIQYYAKNISGSNSYWYQVKEQLKATLQQFGTPTIFWTLSCAELHWPEFHALFEFHALSTMITMYIKIAW